MSAELNESNRYIESQEYYHIERVGPRLAVGEQYFIGKERNRFVGKYDVQHVSFKDSTGKVWGKLDLAQRMLTYLATGNKSLEIEEAYKGDPQAAIRDLKKGMNYFLILIREMIFEEVRQDFFPDLPSRHRCLWLVPVDDEALLLVEDARQAGANPEGGRNREDTSHQPVVPQSHNEQPRLGAESGFPVLGKWLGGERV